MSSQAGSSYSSNTRFPFVLQDIEAFFVPFSYCEESTDSDLISHGRCLFGLKHKDWSNLISLVLGLYPNTVESIPFKENIVIHERLKTFAQKRVVHVNDLKKIWVWSGLGGDAKGLDAPEANYDVYSVGQAFTVMHDGSHLVTIDKEHYGKVFIILPDEEGKSYVHLKFANKGLSSTIEITDEARILVVTNEVVSIEFETTKDATVCYMECPLLYSDWQKFFDFTPRIRPACNFMYWKHIEHLKELIVVRALEKLVDKRLMKVYKEILASDVDHHVILMSSPSKIGLNKSKVYHADLFLNKEELLFFQFCCSKFSNIKCDTVECESEPYKTSKGCPIWKPRHFSMHKDCYENQFVVHTPYPVTEVTYGSHSGTVYEGGEAIDDLDVIVIILEK